MNGLDKYGTSPITPDQFHRMCKEAHKEGTLKPAGGVMYQDGCDVCAAGLVAICLGIEPYVELDAEDDTYSEIEDRLRAGLPYHPKDSHCASRWFDDFMYDHPNATWLDVAKYYKRYYAPQG